MKKHTLRIPKKKHWFCDYYFNSWVDSGLYNYEFYDYNRKKIESLGEYQSLFENNPELRIYCLPKLRKGQ